MKTIQLDTCVINRLLDEKNQPNDNFKFLDSLKIAGHIQIWCSPTNIIEIALCSDYEKRKALSNVLNSLIDGNNVMQSGEAYQIKILFQNINIEIPGVLIDENELLQFSSCYVQLLIGLLGQMAIFPNYRLDRFEHVIRQKLITKYYQARFVSDPDHYLKIYKKQLEGTLNESDVEDDKILDAKTLDEIQAMISALEIGRKKIRNVSDFSKLKKTMAQYFCRHDMRVTFNNFFRYKEHIESSLDLRLLSSKWSQNLFEKGAKPLRVELLDALQGNPSIHAYKELINCLIDRLPEGCDFPLNKMYDLYMNEIEKILNDKKELSGSASLDMDYFPSMMVVQHFITDDKLLYENMRKILKQMGLDELKVLSYSHNWKENIRSPETEV